MIQSEYLGVISLKHLAPLSIMFEKLCTFWIWAGRVVTKLDIVHIQSTA